MTITTWHRPRPPRGQAGRAGQAGQAGRTGPTAAAPATYSRFATARSVLWRWSRAWPRRAAVLAITAGLMLLAAACGGGSATGSSGSSDAVTSGQSQLLGYARCMRSHGLPGFPDPDPSGGFGSAGRSQQSNPDFAAANTACRHLLPAGARQNKIQSNSGAFLRYAQCMRTHGVPDYPDPQPGVNPRTALQQAGIDPNSPQIQGAGRSCDHYLPQRGANLPGGGS